MKSQTVCLHYSVRRGFTLVEVMLSTALIALIMLMLVGTVDQTQKIWTRSSNKATQFQGARAAFEAMTRRMSQATLNTYYRAHDVDVTNAKVDFQFRRLSELQFLSAPMERIVEASPRVTNAPSPSANFYPSHSVFFFAPLGYSEEAGTGQDKDLRRFRSLDSLLAACGYFLEFGDETNRPPFLNNMSPKLPPKYRFRLMEMTVPTERLSIYQRPTDDKRFSDPRVFDEANEYYGGLVDSKRQSIKAWKRPLWMKEALSRETVTGNGGASRFKYARIMADNIVALIVLPKLADRDRVVPGTNTVDPTRLDLVPGYEYDSWRILAGGTIIDPTTKVKLDNTARDNLLPPIVQVTIVAIDDASALRLNASPTNIPKWTQGLFTKIVKEADFSADMIKLEENLQGLHGDPAVSYRIFTTDVVIRGSKWSRDPAIR